MAAFEKIIHAQHAAPVSSRGSICRQICTARTGSHQNLLLNKETVTSPNAKSLQMNSDWRYSSTGRVPCVAFFSASCPRADRVCGMLGEPDRADGMLGKD